MATAATDFSAARQHSGNNKGDPSSRAGVADFAPLPAPVAGNVAENKVHGLVTDEIGLLERYRYGDSNPGFRTENPAS
jgi:hypothetical protein